MATPRLGTWARQMVARDLLTEQQLQEALVRLPNRDVVGEQDDVQLRHVLVDLGHASQFQVEHCSRGEIQKLFFHRLMLHDKIGTVPEARSYRAYHQVQHRQVILKVYPRSLENNAFLGDLCRTRLQRWRRCDRNGIAHLSEVGDDRGVPFTVIEFLKAQDLQTLLAEHQRLAVRTVVNIAHETARILDDLTDDDLRHGNLKPSNVFVTPQGEVLLTDFGPSFSLLYETDKARSNTWDYLAPEHVGEPCEIDKPGDQYMLGCMMYQLITGRLPFTGSTLSEKRKSHRDEQPQPLSEHVPSAPHSLDRLIVTRLMAKHPSERFDTWLEFVEALDDVRPQLQPDDGKYLDIHTYSPRGSTVTSIMKRVMDKGGPRNPAVRRDYTPVRTVSGRKSLGKVGSGVAMGVGLLVLLVIMFWPREKDSRGLHPALTTPEKTTARSQDKPKPKPVLKSRTLSRPRSPARSPNGGSAKSIASGTRSWPPAGDGGRLTRPTVAPPSHISGASVVAAEGTGPLAEGDHAGRPEPSVRAVLSVAAPLLLQPKWVSVGVSLYPERNYVIAAFGKPRLPDSSTPVDADGLTQAADSTWLAPGLRRWSLIGRAGIASRPFQLGNYHRLSVTVPGELEVAFNCPRSLPMAPKSERGAAGEAAGDASGTLDPRSIYVVARVLPEAYLEGELVFSPAQLAAGVSVLKLPDGFAEFPGTPYWKQTGWPQRIVCLRDQAELVLVPGGSFMMGSRTGSYAEQPQHPVTVDGFYMDRLEVTSRQYAQFVRATEHRPPLPSPGRRATLPEYPVTGVSWHDAVAYATWAGRKLPTEGQWEKAARGGDHRQYPWGGGGPELELTNFASVGPNNPARYQKGMAPYGTLAMAGNVWEWCADWYNDYYYQQNVTDNPTGPSSGDERVRRGGSWNDGSRNARVTYRRGIPPGRRYPHGGFRCVWVPSTP